MQKVKQVETHHGFGFYLQNGITLKRSYVSDVVEMITSVFALRPLIVFRSVEVHVTHSTLTLFHTFVPPHTEECAAVLSVQATQTNKTLTSCFRVVSGCIRCLLSSLKVSQLFHMKKKQLRYRRQPESKSQQFSISLEEKRSILTFGPVGSSRGSHFLFELFLHCSMSPGKDKADLICWKRQENRSRQHK